MFAVGGALCLLIPMPAEGQIVRRYPGGGVSVRAPFVRVDVGPYGATSVRAPFVAVDDPGGVWVGPGRRRMRRPGFAEASPYHGQVQAMHPPLAEAPPLPTPEQLSAMDLVTLVGTLRDLSGTLQQSLRRFDDPVGWQRYLEIPEDALGSPGMENLEVRLDVLEKQLTRYDKVAVGQKFAKIAAIPTFQATHAALQLVVERFSEAGPVLIDPAAENWQKDPGPVTEPEDGELLPAPPPSPEPRQGEHSILKRR